MKKTLKMLECINSNLNTLIHNQALLYFFLTKSFLEFHTLNKKLDKMVMLIENQKKEENNP